MYIINNIVKLTNLPLFNTSLGIIYVSIDIYFMFNKIISNDIVFDFNCNNVIFNIVLN
jgi:hypothetical protein